MKYFHVTKFKFVIYIAIFLLYITVAYQSFGYDDEFYNIELVERLGLKAFLYTQTDDVHPPLSILINSILFKFFGSWQIVRIFSAFLISISIIYYCESIENKVQKIFFTILIATSPSLLLWCTSIRWYSYFIPVLFWLVILPKKLNWKYWCKFTIGSLLLAYIGYISFIVIPVIFLIYWLGDKNDLRLKIKYSFFSFVIFIILYSPQIYYFLKFHYINRQDQFGSLFSNIAGVFISEFSNQGIFPLSLAGLLSILGTFLIVLFTILISNKETIKVHNKFYSFIVINLLLIFAGIASKFRNLIVVEPFKFSWLVSLDYQNKFKNLFFTGLTLIIFANILGSWNIITHKDTTKNSWNLPYTELSMLLKSDSAMNKNQILIFVHDPTLTYLLRENGYIVISPYFRTLNKKYIDTSRIVYFIKTFQGSINDSIYKNLMSDFKKLKFAGADTFYLGKDKNYKFKVKLDKRYPEYSIEIIKYKEVENLSMLTEWKKISK